MNLRDYAGAFLMEEDKTKLYYAIRVIKDYLDDGILSEDSLLSLPEDLLATINSSVDEITSLYKKSDYDILAQYMNKKDSYDKDDWDIILTLVRLGHYDVTEDHVAEVLQYYNARFNENVQSIDEIPDSDDPILYGKYHNRISFMKPEAEKLCLEMSKV